MNPRNSIESILEKEGFYIFTGNGNSMLPLIREGVDTVEVRPVDESLYAGDVILFRNKDGRYVLHRIFEVKINEFVTQGDNFSVPETVSQDSIVGVMTKLWRGEEQIPLNSTKYRNYTLLCLNHPRLFKLFKSKFWK